MIKREAQKVARIIASPFERFFQLQSSGGIMLLVSAAVALIWSNSAISDSYFFIWEQKLSIGFGSFQLSKPLHFWVNDGLMAIFFFVVGLEIKQEAMVGELSTMKEAALPVAAAVGGMVVPVLIFFAIVGNGNGADGWGIPMATDIAFSLGVLSLLGKRVPLSLKVFLTALAIVDDIGAILVIAIFYSHDIYWVYIQIAGGLFMLLVAFNYFNLRVLSLYLIIGIGIWFCLLKSGIHPTVAGVLLAMTIPARRKIKMSRFVDQTSADLEEFENAKWPDSKVLLTNRQIHAIESINKSAEEVQSPVLRLENSLGGFVNYVVMPLFALANASIIFGGGEMSLLSSVTLGVGIALLLGKVAGIGLFSWLSVRMGWAKLPDDVTWTQIVGVGILAGIGFTMSIFITNLAYSEVAYINQSKIGIVIASLLAGIIGFIVLKRSLKLGSQKPAAH